jgi:CheY-like chemotaxis protein
MPQPRILLVDDSDSVRTSLAKVLETNKFTVVATASVNEALSRIGAELFDILLCDLHLPGAGDGLTVVSAMRHSNPQAVTLVFSGYPEMQEAMYAILLQADEILVKPLQVPKLIELIHQKLQNPTQRSPVTKETVATILERDRAATVQDWLTRIDRDTEVSQIPLSFEERTGHLPKLLSDVIVRLRHPRSPEAKEPVCEAAEAHGKLRRKQGYTPAMIVEESRMLQVSIFQTLQHNLQHVDFSVLLMDVMAIADEVDSQLKQTIRSYTEQSTIAAHLAAHSAA